MGSLLRACVQAVWLTLAIGVASCSPASTGGSSDEEPPPPSEERRTVHVAMEGGQSGMEGGCRFTGKPEMLNFSAEDVRALVQGPYESTLAYRSWLALPSSGDSAADTRGVTVSVRLIGEPEAVARCGGPQLLFDAEVTLAFAKPALDVVIAVTLTALSSELASAELKLPPSVVAAMELPGVELPEVESSFLLQFTTRGPQATLWLQRGCDGGSVRLPSDARCDPGEPEVELTQPLYGARPGDVLQSCVDQLSKWGSVPVQWNDGTTTALSISIEQEPRAVCGGLDALFETGQAGYFQAPLRARIKTSDGRIDLGLPANLVWQVFPEHRAGGSAGWDGQCSLSTESSFQVGALRADDQVRGVELPGSGAVYMHLLAGGPPDRIQAGFALKEWGPMCSGEPRPIAALATPGSPP